MASPSQLGLFGQLPALSLGRHGAGPRVWVKRLLVWHDLAREPFREVTLERGLNIIWSPSGDTPEDDALPSGHAAGKTLFCRAIRFCLGEHSFAAPDDLPRLRARFPKGGVGAEVVVDDQTWAVRRPFAGGSDLAVLAGDVRDLPPGEPDGFDVYLDALQRTLGDAQRVECYPQADGHRPWQFVLAWLTRDQECRVEGIGSWRHKDTGSRSPVRSSSAEQRLRVLRLALGIYDTEARERASRIESLASNVSAANAEVTELTEKLAEQVRDLARALGLTVEEVRPNSLPGTLWINEYRHRMRALARARIAALRRPPQPAVEHADDARLAELEVELAVLGARLASERSAVEALRGERALHAGNRPGLQRRVNDAKHPVCPFDGAALDVEASKIACPLVKFPDVKAEKAALDAVNARMAEINADLAVREPMLEALEKDHASCLNNRDHVERRVKLRRNAEDREQAAHDGQMAAAWGAGPLVDSVVELTERLAAAEHRLRQAASSLEALRGEENEARSAVDIARMSSWFDALVQRVLGKGASGTVRLDGNGLHAVINQRSVALNSLRVVLFDLAAMLCAAEGRAHVPAFLLHDSPREGDLDPSTYRRIFRAVHALAPVAQQACFQYIITTTSPPPEDLPAGLVRQRLAAWPATERFYGADL